MLTVSLSHLSISNLFEHFSILKFGYNLCIKSFSPNASTNVAKFLTTVATPFISLEFVCAHNPSSYV